MNENTQYITDKQREAYMIHQQNETLKQTAEELNISISTLREKLQAVEQKLKEADEFAQDVQDVREAQEA